MSPSRGRVLFTVAEHGADAGGGGWHEGHRTRGREAGNARWHGGTGYEGESMNLYYKNDLPNGGASTGRIVDRADGLVAAEVYGVTPEACDALGRQMAAGPELVELLREVVAEAGPLGHDGYHENPLHGDTITEARTLLKKAGVEP